MYIALLGKRAVSLMEEFDKAGIAYSKRRPGQPGQIMNAPELVIQLGDLIKDHSGWVAAASVMIAWLKASSKRKITITMPDGKIYSTEGLSPDDFALVLQNAKDLMAIEAGIDLPKATTPAEPKTEKPGG